MAGAGGGHATYRDEAAWRRWAGSGGIARWGRVGPGATVGEATGEEATWQWAEAMMGGGGWRRARRVVGDDREGARRSSGALCGGGIGGRRWAKVGSVVGAATGEEAMHRWAEATVEGATGAMGRGSGGRRWAEEGATCGGRRLGIGAASGDGEERAWRRQYAAVGGSGQVREQRASGGAYGGGEWDRKDKNRQVPDPKTCNNLLCAYLAHDKDVKNRKDYVCRLPPVEHTTKS